MVLIFRGLRIKKSLSPRIRSRKRKLPGGEISIPTLSTASTISVTKAQLIESGELPIGEPCSPYILTKSVLGTDGNIVEKVIQVDGRKIPLLELRKRFIKQHQEYMRLTTDAELKAQTRPNLIHMANNIHLKFPTSVSDDQLRHHLAHMLSEHAH